MKSTLEVGLFVEAGKYSDAIVKCILREIQADQQGDML